MIWNTCVGLNKLHTVPFEVVFAGKQEWLHFELLLVNTIDSVWLVTQYIASFPGHTGKGLFQFFRIWYQVVATPTHVYFTSSFIDVKGQFCEPVWSTQHPGNEMHHGLRVTARSLWTSQTILATFALSWCCKTQEKLVTVTSLGLFEWCSTTTWMLVQFNHAPLDGYI